MKIGFYSPLKAADHPVASGDRAMARGLISVLQTLGHEVTQLCRLRSFDSKGDARRQSRLRQLGDEAVKRVCRSVNPLELIFTYHCYHKAPDWLGPALAKRWRCPYVIAEASIANKQAGGPWDIGHQAVIDAVGRADHVLALTQLDARALADYVASSDRLGLLRPFIELPPKPPSRPATTSPRLLTVAMMREDVKLQSYQLLAQALTSIATVDWTLDIVGAGPAEACIRDAFKPLGGRVRFHGVMQPNELAHHYRAADLFVWPGLREAYGMVYLEAQAYGLPVVAIENSGVPEVVIDGQTGLLSPTNDPRTFGQCGLRLILNQKLRHLLSSQARAHVEQRHSFEQASSTIARMLARVGGSCPAS